MEPIEESTTLSPKESIVNILGRLFNNGHISGDELAMMQMELVARNAEPKPINLTEETLQELVDRMKEAASQVKTDPQSLRTWGSAGAFHVHGSNPLSIPSGGTHNLNIGHSTSSDTFIVHPDANGILPEKYPLGTKTAPAPWIHGYVDTNKLTDFLKDAEDI